jgi:hypothetical protein
VAPFKKIAIFNLSFYLATVYVFARGQGAEGVVNPCAASFSGF